MCSICLVMYFYKYMFCDIFFHWFNKYIFRTPRWESCHTDMCKGKWFVYRIIFFAFSYCSIFFLVYFMYMRPLWSLGSWIYNYLCNQLHITTKVVSSNLDMVYSIQHYMIKFVSDLRQVCVFLRYSGFLY